MNWLKGDEAPLVKACPVKQGLDNKMPWFYNYELVVTEYTENISTRPINAALDPLYSLCRIRFRGIFT